MIVLAFVTDLMFRSKIDGAARALGKKVIYAPAGAEPATAATAAGEKPALAIVDLGYKGGDPMAAIAAARAAGCGRVIAFGTHVEHETLERARAAGADLALPRSTFTRHLTQILNDEDIE